MRIDSTSYYMLKAHVGLSVSRQLTTWRSAGGHAQRPAFLLEAFDSRFRLIKTTEELEVVQRSLFKDIIDSKLMAEPTCHARLRWVVPRADRSPGNNRPSPFDRRLGHRSW